VDSLPIQSDTCAFCGSPNACYQKKDRAGEWVDVCWGCVAPKPKPAPAPDLSFLDDPDPVSLTPDTTPKRPGMLF
jgi:hypothetical protein